jgi:hypothetical protein
MEGDPATIALGMGILPGKARSYTSSLLRTFVLRLRERAISVGYLLYVFVGLRGFRDLFGKLNRQT